MISANFGIHGLTRSFNDAGHSSHASTTSSAMMATICEMVLCLPNCSAASTTFFDAASSRRPVIASSRATMTMTIHEATFTGAPGWRCVLSTKAMNAEQVMILSASGSISTPKFVMSLRSRAIFPSRKSEMPARQKMNSASVSWLLNCENSAQRKSAVSTKRDTVSLFGRFIQIKSSSSSSSFSFIHFEDEHENEEEKDFSGAELVEHPRVGLHEAHQKFRLEHAERAEVRASFGEAFQLVRTARRRVQQHRLRMPRMPLKRARRRMVAGDDQHVRIFPQQNRQRGVKILNRVHLGVKISVLAGFVRVFEMDEEEIVVVVFDEVTLELLGDGRRAFDFFHADELRESLIHRINREARGLELVAIFKQRNVRLMRDAAHEKTVRRMLF